MHLTSTLLTLCAASLTFVSASSETIVSHFDNLRSNPIAVSDADLIIKPYDGLKFSGFFARQDGLSVLRSRSKNNTASSSTLDRQLAGAPPPNITSIYPGSKTKYFSLVETYLGCAVTSEASAGVPQPCTLLFKAIKKDGSRVQQTCSYSGTALNPALQFCNFGSGFKEITFVSVEVDTSLTLPTLTVEYLDDLKHTNFY